MDLLKHQLYLLEPHSEPFKSWSVIIRIHTEGKTLIVKLGPGLDTILSFNSYKLSETLMSKEDRENCMHPELLKTSTYSHILIMYHPRLSKQIK